MNTKSGSSIVALFALLVCIAVPEASNAEGYPRADAQAAKSLTHAMGVPILSTLRRQPASLALVVSSLSAAVCKSACTTLLRDTLPYKVRVRGAQWHLDVYGDGSMAEFVDEAVAARAHGAGVAPSRALTKADLETRGRAYIASQLANVIALRPNEALVAESASTRAEGGVSSAGFRAPDLVTGQRVVFSREIDGIPVVGLGSKVALTFLNDGSLESFRYDWPVYASTGSVQATAGVVEIVQRLQRVVTHETRSAPPIVYPLTSLPATGPVDLTSDVQLQRLECGYYDAGLLNRDAAAPLQAGCVYHALHFLSGDHPGKAGLAGAVPAAAQPDADNRWREESLLRGVVGSGTAAPSAATPDMNSRPSPARQP